MPAVITSDTDPHFTNRFWQELFKLLDTQLQMSSTAHPQTNGQMERVNQSLEDYIRCYVQADQKDWTDHIDMLEFCYNSSKHSATGFSPFELATGKQVLTPLALVSHVVRDKIKEPDVDLFLADWQATMRVAQQGLQQSKERMVRAANKKRQHIEFFKGDLVLVSAVHWPLPGGLSPKFNHRYYGPYEVLQSFNGVTYKLKLPSSVKVHDTFHVSLLKRFHADKRGS